MDHHEARDHFQKWLVFSALQFAALPGFGDLTNLFVEAPPALESTVVVETVVEPPLDEVLQISGRVSVNQNALAKIGPSISGRVIEVKADIGQTVFRGQVLAVIQSIELSDTQAKFLKAKSQVELKRLDVERYRNLYDEGITSLPRLRERESALTEKEIEMNALADQLIVMGMHADDIRQISRQKGVDSNTPITATIHGTVIDRRISLGQIVEISDDLFMVADLTEVWIEAEVPERSAIPFEINTPTEIEIPALAHQTFKGRLSFIDKTEDPESRTIKIRVVLSNQDLRLKPEMLASISIHKPSFLSFSVPANEVIRDQDQDCVFVQTESHRYTLRTVVLDQEVNGSRRVISGLNPGEKIVTRGNPELNIVRLQSQRQ